VVPTSSPATSAIMGPAATFAQQVEIERHAQERRLQAHARELRDSIWAPEMEEKLQGAFAKLPLDAQPTVSGVDCRHTSCVAELTFGAADGGPPDLASTVSSLGVPCARYVMLDSPPGAAPAHATFYADCESSRFGTEEPPPVGK
jgi:hypothetical protein